jgi:hypothetical protein
MEDRAALVVQRYWRGYTASRELRRRRWAARRKRWVRAGVGTLLAAPITAFRAVLRAVFIVLWSLLRAFWLVRAVVWFTACVPRALIHALVSWEAVAGAVVSTALTARYGDSDTPTSRRWTFRNYFAAYVLGFVLLDVCARNTLVKPAVAMGAAARRGLAAVAKLAFLIAARLSPTVASETAIYRLAVLLRLINEVPRRVRVLRTRPPPLVVPMPKQAVAKDPELIGALRAAETSVRESRAHAAQLEERLGKMDRKLETFQSLSQAQAAAGEAQAAASEAQAAAASETSKRAAAAVEYAMQEAKRLNARAAAAAAAAAAATVAAATPPSREPEIDNAMNTSLVDERIDKRFEDMEAMLRAARDEGRAEGVREGSERLAQGDAQNMESHSFDRSPRLDPDDLTSARPETVAAIERGVKEGMERGILKGIQLERTRKKQTGWGAVKRMLGLGSSKALKLDKPTKKQAEATNRNRVAIRERNQRGAE